MVSTGLYDSQVQYYEPAKWVARLRAAKHAAGDDAQPLVLQGQHERPATAAARGASRGCSETAAEYAFMVDLAQAH